MSDYDEDESTALFGTPLDPIEEDEVPRKKPLNLEDQVATDAQGRRRFHGAFTGGFSAGFFNSVGSLEGWKPSEFKSSRAGKAERKTQKPEDFMDDEDMGEHGIAPSVLRSTSEFTDLRGRKRERPHPSDGPIPGRPVLHELIQPVSDTVGIKLLKRMGWKPGQGIGPRLTRSEKQRANQENRNIAGKVYGCSLPDFTVAHSDGESSDDDATVTFAPDDYEPFLCKPKENCFGIGYVGLDKNSVLSSHINLFEPSSLQMMDKNKRKVNITGQAFGVGAFEEDDADIYARDDMTQYDFALDSSSKRKSSRKQRWSDAQVAPSCLEGFELAAQSTVKKKHFPPPIVPKDFKPMHTARKSRFDPVPPKEANSSDLSKRKGLERHALTSEDRSHIIGEKTTRPAVVESPVLVEIHKKIVPATVITPTKEDNTYSNTGRFRPFVADPEKQKRYEKFLTLDQKDNFSQHQPISMLEWEREHEKMEFEQACRLYRPMTGIMNDRFVSATQHDDMNNPLATVDRTKPDANHDVIQAAKMKMFGRLTRERIEWIPASLLCKRFNIPEPFTNPDIANSTSQKKLSKFSVFDFLDAAQHNTKAHEEEVEEKDEVEECPTSSIPNTSQSIILEAKDMSDTKTTLLPKNVNLEFPDLPEKVDLFKAIFLSSSDDDPDSDEETKSSPLPTIVPLQNIQRNMSPPRGVFANIDMDAINQVKKNTPEKPKPQSSTLDETIITPDDVLPPDVFGPRLPTSLPIPTNILTKKTLERVRKNSSSSDSSENLDKSSSYKWVEKNYKSSHKERSSGKHKSKKSHKKASKHKKHKSHKKKHKK